MKQKLILLVAISVMAASCGVRKTNKTDSDFAQTSQGSEDRKESSKETIKEVIDTTATIAGVSGEIAKPLNDIRNSQPLYIETDRYISRTWFDSITGLLHNETTIKDYKVPVKKEKTTQREKQADIQTKYKTITKHHYTTKYVDRESPLSSWFWILIAAGFIAGIIVGRFITLKARSLLTKCLIFLPALLIFGSCSSNDPEPSCNCPTAIYQNVNTGENRLYDNEPLDCSTGVPIEPVKQEMWIFYECKYKPDF